MFIYIFLILKSKSFIFSVNPCSFMGSSDWTDCTWNTFPVALVLMEDFQL